MSEQKSSKSIASIAGIVAFATLISKVFGLLREQIVARAFGVGATVNAYSYAYIVPGFLLILLGGINGPFHSALVSVLSKRPKEEARPIVEAITTLVSAVFIVITFILIIFADKIVDLLAPGLTTEIRSSAILQLQIMSPLAIFAGLIGIGFGTLNASDQYWIPSISPLFSSITVVIGVGFLLLQFGDKIANSEYLYLGGIVLAGTTLAGGILQWIIQQIALLKSGLGTWKLRFNWNLPGVKDVLKVMTPATLSSGMLHINVYTDMYFASSIPTAAAAMRYANFIALTPLGIISNMILVPLMPIFSRLTAPENWSDLKDRIRQGLLLTALTMLPLSAIFISQAYPIIQVIYQYGVFNASATGEVAPVLMAYAVGMFFYLGRDVLVRVFYALGDGETPFRISIINIVLNAVLDWLLVKQFGTPGIILATVSVNILSMIWLMAILHQRLRKLPLVEWSLILSGLIGCSVVSGMVSYGIHQGWQSIFPQSHFILQLIQITLASALSLLTFTLLAMQMKLPELDLLKTRILTKLKRQ